MRARITEVAIAPPRPCRKRAAISIELAVGDGPQSAEATVKSRDAGEEDALATEEVAEAAGRAGGSSPKVIR